MSEQQEKPRPRNGSFHPTFAMRKYAEACATGARRTEQQRCRKANVEPATVRRWKARPAFRRWLRREVVELRRGNASDLWNEVLCKALKGDLRAIKLYLDRFDQMRKSDVEEEEKPPETFLDLALLVRKAREIPQELYLPGNEAKLDEVSARIEAEVKG